MSKLKLIVFILLINCSLFANKQNFFELESKKNIKSFLSTNYENLLISKPNLEEYYINNNFKPYWIDENGLKEIAISLLDKIKNDPVLKPQSIKLFRLDEVNNTLNSLNKSNANYLENLVKMDLMLTELFDRYVTYVTKGSIDWSAFELKLAELEKEKEIKASCPSRQNRVHLHPARRELLLPWRGLPLFRFCSRKSRAPVLKVVWRS